MNFDIRFSYDGVDYVVDQIAYDKECIVLPDNRVLYPTGWLESLPPQVMGFDTANPELGVNPQQTAEMHNGTVAWLATDERPAITPQRKSLAGVGDLHEDDGNAGKFMAQVLSILP